MGGSASSLLDEGKCTYIRELEYLSGPGGEKEVKRKIMTIQEKGHN